MPPSLSFHSFFFLSRIFLFLSILVAVRRPCSSIYPLFLPFFFASYSNIYPQSNRHRPFTITSRFFLLSLALAVRFSLFSALHRARERERRKITTIITNTKRTASSAKMYADSRFCTLTTLFSTFSLSFSSFFVLPSEEKREHRTVFRPASLRAFFFRSLIITFILFFFCVPLRLMTKPNDQENIQANGGESGTSTNSVVIVPQQQQLIHDPQQHFVLSAVNNTAPMIITTPLGKTSTFSLSRSFTLSFSCFFRHYPTIANNSIKWSNSNAG